MIHRKKGKKTPENLDFAFKRELINEDDYKEFWPRWWGASEHEREEIIRELLEKGISDDPELPLKGDVTKKKKVAVEQAKAIGGYVIRRKKNGQFSKRGRFYQAIKRGGRKK